MRSLHLMFEPSPRGAEEERTVVAQGRARTSQTTAETGASEDRLKTMAVLITFDLGGVGSSSGSSTDTPGPGVREAEEGPEEGGAAAGPAVASCS